MQMQKQITAKAIQHYAMIAKDHADIHLDVEAAIQWGYDRPIAHGMYMMGLAQSLYIAEHPSQWITTYAIKFSKSILVDSKVIFHFSVNKSHVEVQVLSTDQDLLLSGHLVVKEIS